jgi:hypothetical protein
MEGTQSPTKTASSLLPKNQSDTEKTNEIKDAAKIK